MRISIILILAIFLFLMAVDSEAAPANGWTTCSQSYTSWEQVTISAGTTNRHRVCLEIDSNHTGDKSFFLDNQFGKLCVNTDVTDKVTGALVFDLKYCPGDGPASEETCPILIASITEAVCVELSYGRYWLDFVTQPAAGEEAVIEVRRTQ